MTWHGHRLIIFGFLPQISKTKTKTVAVGVSAQQWRGLGEQARSATLDDLAVFRCVFYDCLTLRADALFELTDAVLCADGPVTTLVGLTLAAEHRRGHGGLYDGLGSGRIDLDRLRRSLVNLPVPRDAQGRITLGVDVSPWLRPDAATCPDRSFCHVYGRGKGQAQMIPGWPYSFVAALEPGRTSWTALLDAVRLGPHDDATKVTATQLREEVERLQQAGQHKPGDADILIVFDAGYDVTRLAFLLADLPVELLGRLRSDRVFSSPPPRAPSATGRPSKHGPEFALAEIVTQPEPDAITVTDTSRYGTARACAWNRLHPRLTHRAAWECHDGPLPLIEGSIIRLQVDRLPGDRNPKPVWLWDSRPEAFGSRKTTNGCRAAVISARAWRADVASPVIPSALVRPINPLNDQGPGSAPLRAAMAWRYQRAAVLTCPRKSATAAHIKLVIVSAGPGVSCQRSR